MCVSKSLRTPVSYSPMSNWVVRIKFLPIDGSGCLHTQIWERISFRCKTQSIFISFSLGETNSVNSLGASINWNHNSIKGTTMGLQFCECLVRTKTSLTYRVRKYVWCLRYQKWRAIRGCELVLLSIKYSPKRIRLKSPSKMKRPRLARVHTSRLIQ